MDTVEAVEHAPDATTPQGDSGGGDAEQDHSQRGPARPRRPFRLTSKGVEKRVETEGGVEWHWFCSQLEVVAVTRDADGEDWGRLLVVTDRDGRRHEWAMPMQMLAADGAIYRERLLSLGLELAPGSFARKALHEYIATARPKDRARCVSRIGWHDRAFILPDATYGDTKGEHVLLQTGTGGSHAFRVAGSLEDWQDQIGRWCVGNSRLVFAVSAAFAAPLLYLADAESGGFNLIGPSQIGKTTALRVAGSVWGGGGINGFLKTWRATSNGLEGTAKDHCDVLLCLDEMSQVDGREAGQVAYMLANGEGKQRARRDGSGRPPAQWRSLFLSSGEIGLADKMAEAGKLTTAGQEVRLADLPADAGVALGLFEALHDFPSPDAFARHLREATRRYYGEPARAFLKQLTAVEENARADAITKARDRFIAPHVPPGASGQVISVAARFGLIAAAGELATEMKIVPWPQGEATRAAETCLMAWLERRGGAGATEVEKGIAKVRLFLEKHGDSRFEYVSDDSGLRFPSPFNRAGFQKENKDGSLEYFVLPGVWRSEVCAGFDHQAMARAMAARGLLLPSADGRMTRKERVGRPDTVWVYRITAAIFDDPGEPASPDYIGDAGDNGDTQ